MKRLETIAPRTTVSTINPCRVCAPLGASLAIRGISQAMPVLHGSQGCATYIRRYLVSHYREPMDVASSSFGEQATIFGGASNLEAALDNVMSRYSPSLIGVATTCLAETIGDDVAGIVKRWARERGSGAPRVVHASTPAYSGSHAEGYAATVLAIVAQLAENTSSNDQVNVFAPMSASPADIRHLRELVEDFELRPALVPDFSDTLDGGSWEEYEPIPKGGTTLAELTAMGGAQASISFDGVVGASVTPGNLLEQRFGVQDHNNPLPIGLVATDKLFAALESISNRPCPAKHSAERGRLLDSMVDAHKVLFEQRIALVGDQALVVGLAAFCAEVGLRPVLCATGSNPGKLKSALAECVSDDCIVLEDTDHTRVSEVAKDLKLDLVVGPSKVRAWARPLGVPVIHLGFPIHDRFGAARLRTFGYEGALQLLDRITNTLLERRQEEAGLGWAYL